MNKNDRAAFIGSGVVLVVSALPMCLSQDASFFDTLLSLWAIFFFIGFCLIALEGKFFLKSPEILRISQFVMAFIGTGLIAAIAAGLVGAHRLEFTLGDKLQVLLSEQSRADWIIRFIGAAGLFTAAYGVIGSVTWPFVREYYENPGKGLALRVPNGRIIIALQMVRGLFTTLALVPLIATIPASGMVWAFRLSFLLAGCMAIAPLLMYSGWPGRLRFVHALEISVFAVAYSFVVWWLIA